MVRRQSLSLYAAPQMITSLQLFFLKHTDDAFLPKHLGKTWHDGNKRGSEDGELGTICCQDKQPHRLSHKQTLSGQKLVYSQESKNKQVCTDYWRDEQHQKYIRKLNSFLSILYNNKFKTLYPTSAEEQDKRLLYNPTVLYWRCS